MHRMNVLPSNNMAATALFGVFQNIIFTYKFSVNLQSMSTALLLSGETLIQGNFTCKMKKPFAETQVTTRHPK